MSNSSVSHPKGLYLLFATEMWERFSYYGNRALLALFMVSALAFDKHFTAALYGQYTGLVFLTPLIGGYIADRYWGNRRSIRVGGILMAAGQFMLFFAASVYSNLPLALPLFYSGLALICLGNGFFKPNISIMVGQLYRADDSRKDAAYTIFYMGINLGSFAAPLICGTLGDTGNPADFRWGFLVAGVGMLLSLVIFESLKSKYLRGPNGEPLGLPPKRLSAAERAKVDLSLSTIDIQRMAVIGVLAFFVIFFWAAFEQAGVSLTFFARESTDRMLWGFEVPASWFQSINPVFVLIFAPLMARLWSAMSARGTEPSSPSKMAWGLILLGIGYAVIALGVDGIADGVKVSMLWLITMYWLHTMGELCLSPIGLSLVNKLAPARFASLLMAVWFLAVAAANWFAGILAGFYPESGRPLPSLFGWQIANLHDFFMLFVAMSLLAGGLLLLASKPLQKMMHGVR